jgi:hypothetical protein
MHDRILSKNVTIAGRRVTHERFIRTNRGDSGGPSDSGRKRKETRTDRILERYFSTVDTGFFDQSYAICIECLHV